jgi:hypothetical protein
MSHLGLGCSLIPGVVVKLSRILAGPMVLSAVGARPPHDGVRCRWWIQCVKRVLRREHRKTRAISPPRAALACLASMQMTGNPRLFSSVHNQVDVAPASSPTRATFDECDSMSAAIASGSEGTTSSRWIFPVRSTMQIAVSFNDMSSTT